jgi:hypothetical protein
MIQLLRDDKVVVAFTTHEANPNMTDQLVHLIAVRVSPLAWWGFGTRG